MYNIFKDVLNEIEKEFNPLRLRYWKPTKPEIIMILILITVLYFGISYVWSYNGKHYSVLHNTLYLRQYNTRNDMKNLLILILLLITYKRW